MSRVPATQLPTLERVQEEAKQSRPVELLLNADTCVITAVMSRDTLTSRFVAYSHIGSTGVVKTYPQGEIV